MKNNIPTAEEFIQNYDMNFKDGKSPLVHLIKEFAKLHCEAQLKAILAKITTYILYQDENGVLEEPIVYVDKDSIVTAYSLDNIK